MPMADGPGVGCGVDAGVKCFKRKEGAIVAYKATERAVTIHLLFTEILIKIAVLLPVSWRWT